MGKLSLVNYDGGDDRTNVTCNWLAEGKDIKVWGQSLESETEPEVVEVDGKRYAIEECAVKNDWGRFPDSKHFQGCVFDAAVSEKVRKGFSSFLDLIEIAGTPLDEPINCEYHPRAYEHWSNEVAGFEKEIPDFDRSFFGL